MRRTRLICICLISVPNKSKTVLMSLYTACPPKTSTAQNGRLLYAAAPVINIICTRSLRPWRHSWIIYVRCGVPTMWFLLLLFFAGENKCTCYFYVTLAYYHSHLSSHDWDSFSMRSKNSIHIYIRKCK